MNRKKIGILELYDEPFINDLVARLDNTEFINFREEIISPSSQYSVILDRVSHYCDYLREMLKGFALDGCYVINNPFAAAETNKMVDIRICRHLNISVPKTIVLPDLSICQELPGMIKEPDFEKVANEISFPCIMKPYNGYGWEDVYIINNLGELIGKYSPDTSKKVYMIQALVEYVSYYRVFCIGKKEVFFTSWVPKPLGAGEYTLIDPPQINDTIEDIARMTMRLNISLDLDINVLEWCLDKDGKPWLIDAYNEVPDIPKNKLPDKCYWWIVERTAELIMEKYLDGFENNRSSFIIPD